MVFYVHRATQTRILAKPVSLYQQKPKPDLFQIHLVRNQFLTMLWPFSLSLSRFILVSSYRINYKPILTVCFKSGFNGLLPNLALLFIVPLHVQLVVAIPYSLIWLLNSQGMCGSWNCRKWNWNEINSIEIVFCCHKWNLNQNELHHS